MMKEEESTKDGSSQGGHGVGKKQSKSQGRRERKRMDD